MVRDKDRILSPVPETVPGFYVYEHWRPDTHTCFYVGKGKGDRCRDRDRNFYHKRVTHSLKLAGLQLEIRIVASDLKEDEAFRVERERISFWRDAGADLCNQTEGGEGSAYFSEEAIQKIREARARQTFTSEYKERHRAAMASPDVRAKISAKAKARTNQNPFLGRKHSPETLAAWSAKRKGVKLSEEHKAKIAASVTANNGFRGKKHSEETRRKISEARRRQSNA